MPVTKALGAMDPLQRLAERNRKHIEIKSAERVSNIKSIIAFAFLQVTYYGLYYFSLYNADAFVDTSFLEGSKQVWLISTSFIGGIGGLFIVSALRIFITSKINFNGIEHTIETLFNHIISIVFIGLGFIFFLLANYVTIELVDYNALLNEFFRMGNNEVPFPMISVLNFVFGGLTFIFFVISVSIMFPSYADEFIETST